MTKQKSCVVSLGPTTLFQNPFSLFPRETQGAWDVTFILMSVSLITEIPGLHVSKSECCGAVFAAPISSEDLPESQENIFRRTSLTHLLEQGKPSLADFQLPAHESWQWLWHSHREVCCLSVWQKELPQWLSGLFWSAVITATEILGNCRENEMHFTLELNLE